MYTLSLPNQEVRIGFTRGLLPFDSWVVAGALALNYVDESHHLLMPEINIERRGNHRHKSHDTPKRPFCLLER